MIYLPIEPPLKFADVLALLGESVKVSKSGGVIKSS